MQRDRTQTEQRLLDAVEHIITNNGLDQVGINRVARQAGITKILIYRYFGGLDGLLEAYYKRYRAARTELNINTNDFHNQSITEVMNMLCEITLREYRKLRDDVQMQEFLKADLLGNDLLINPLVNEREGKLRQLIDNVANTIDSKAGRPFSAIVICAMSSLTFMSQQKRSILDIDLSSEEGWVQIEDTMRGIYKGIALLLESRLTNPVEKPL